MRSHKIYWFDILHLIFNLWHLSFDINMILPWHLTLICHDTWHLICLWHWYAMTFDIDGSLSWHLISDMWHLVFDIWHWNYMIWYSKTIFAQTYLFFTDGLWGCINNLKTAFTWNLKKIWGWGWRWGLRWGWDEMRWDEDDLQLLNDDLQHLVSSLQLI